MATREGQKGNSTVKSITTVISKINKEISINFHSLYQNLLI